MVRNQKRWKLVVNPKEASGKVLRQKNHCVRKLSNKKKPIPLPCQKEVGFSKKVPPICNNFSRSRITEVDVGYVFVSVTHVTYLRKTQGGGLLFLVSKPPHHSLVSFVLKEAENFRVKGNLLLLFTSH